MITERFLYQIEEMFAISQNRQPCDVAFAEFPASHKDIISMFERDSYSILFNMEKVDELDESEVVGSLIHEGRHAYQWVQVYESKNPVEPQETLEIWKEEFQNYLQPTDNNSNLKYVSQTLEIDAVAYTAIQLEKLELGRLIIPEEIKTQVQKRILEIKAK